jgi:hypothetical protein
MHSAKLDFSLRYEIISSALVQVGGEVSLHELIN